MAQQSLARSCNLGRRRRSCSRWPNYRDRLKGVQVLLSNSQVGPGREVKQEQEEISRNHVQSREKVFVRGCEKYLPALA